MTDQVSKFNDGEYTPNKMTKLCNQNARFAEELAAGNLPLRVIKYGLRFLAKEFDSASEQFANCAKALETTNE